MTSWTEVTDKSTTWTETGEVSTSYTKVPDDVIQWKSFGGLVRLCTEGLREDLMTEDREDYIVVSHGEDVEIWTDTANVSSAWTKINDI